MSNAEGTSGLNNYLQNKNRLASLSWVDKISGPNNAPLWTCSCKIDGKVRGIGSASRKHIAKNIAATEALKSLLEEEV